MSVETIRNNTSLAIGFIGAGHIARLYHLPILANIPDVELKYVADIDTKKAQRLTTTYDADVVEAPSDPGSLPDCDIAGIATPVGVRRPYIEEFGSRRVPVFSEKPFAPDEATHEVFADVIEMVYANYMRTTFQTVRQVKQMVETDIFGQLCEVKFTEGGITGATGKGQSHYQTDVELSGGGLLLQNGCHPISQLCTILEDWDFSVVSSDLGWSGDFEVDVEATLKAERNSSTVDIEFALTQIRPLDNRAEFRFEHATVWFDQTDATATVTVEPADTRAGSRQWTFDPDEAWATNLDQAHYLRWRQFLDDVHREESGAGETLPEVTSIMERIYDQSENA